MARLLEKDIKTFGDDIESLGDDIGLPLVTHIGSKRSHSAQSITWHSHHDYELIFMLEGAAAYEFWQRPTLEVLGGQFLVIPPEAVHRGVHDVRTPSTICGLLFDPGCRGGWRNTPLAKEELRWISKRLAQSGAVACPFGHDLKGPVARLMQEQRAFKANRQDPLVKASLRLWACAVVLGAVRELTTPRPASPAVLVVAAQEYLKQHLAEPIRMSDLINHIGRGRSRLFESFKSITGLTPNDYLLRLRVKKAQELLAQPGQSLTEIALTTGFSSGQYFSNVFRKYTGQTPRECRREAS